MRKSKRKGEKFMEFIKDADGKIRMEGFYCGLIDKENVEDLLKNKHPMASEVCEPAVEGIVDLIERGKWSADTGIIAVDKEGRVHDGIQRLEAMRRVMSYVADLKLWVTIRFGVEFKPLPFGPTPRTLDEIARLVYNESYGEPYREVVEFLYRYVGFSFVPIRDDELRWGHPMLAEEYVYITKVDRGTRYYKYKQLKFPEEGEVSKVYFRAMFFLLIQSGQWEIDSIKHLLDVLVNGSEDKKDLKVISHFADAKLETGIFKTNENGCKWSDFDLIEQHLSLFIPYLDLIEGNRKNVRLLSQKKVEDFVDKQLRGIFSILAAKRYLERKEFARQNNIPITPIV